MLSITPSEGVCQRTAPLCEAVSNALAVHRAARRPPARIDGKSRHKPTVPAAEVWINPPENRPTVRTLELPRDTKF